VFGDALDPTLADIGVGDPGIERVVADRDLLLLNYRITKGVRPVEKVIQLDTPARRNFGRTLGCGVQIRKS